MAEFTSNSIELSSIHLEFNLPILRLGTHRPAPEKIDTHNFCLTFKVGKGLLSIYAPVRSTIYPSGKGVMVKERLEPKDMFTLALKVDPDSETPNLKATLRHRGDKGIAWLTQLMDVLDVLDYPVPGPLYLPIRTVLSLGNFSVSSNLIAATNTSCLRFLAQECMLFLYHLQGTKSNVAVPQDDDKQPDLNKDYVCVMDLGLFELIRRKTHRRNKRTISHSTEKEGVEIFFFPDESNIKRQMMDATELEDPKSMEYEDNVMESSQDSKPMNVQVAKDLGDPSTPKSTPKKAKRKKSAPRSQGQDNEMDEPVVNWIGGPGPVYMCDNHFTVPAARSDVLKAPKSFPLPVLSRSKEYEPYESGRALTAAYRSAGVSWAPGADRVRARNAPATRRELRTRGGTLAISKIEVIDQLVCSDINKLLSQYKLKDEPERVNAHMTTPTHRPPVMSIASHLKDPPPTPTSLGDGDSLSLNETVIRDEEPLMETYEAERLVSENLIQLEEDFNKLGIGQEKPVAKLPVDSEPIDDSPIYFSNRHPRLSVAASGTVAARRPPRARHTARRGLLHGAHRRRRARHHHQAPAAHTVTILYERYYKKMVKGVPKYFLISVNYPSAITDSTLLWETLYFACVVKTPVKNPTGKCYSNILLICY
ncbi:Autophagy-related protein 2-like protein A, partial [Operophtera brumata]